MDVLNWIRKTREGFRERERQFFEKPWQFLVFSLSLIVLMLLLYTRGYGDLVTASLAILWFVFWRNSGPLGKAFLVIASVIGFAHEVMGVWLGAFVYLTQDMLNVPLFLLPGYGCIYWAAENFWAHLRESYYLHKWMFNGIVLVTVAGMVAADWLWLGFAKTMYFDLAFLGALVLLFSRLPAREQYLGYVVGVLTGLDEVLGVWTGAWTHRHLALTAVVPSYVFFVWISLVMTHSLAGRRKATNSEMALGVAAVLLKVATWFAL